MSSYKETHKSIHSAHAEIYESRKASFLTMIKDNNNTPARSWITFHIRNAFWLNDTLSKSSPL